MAADISDHGAAQSPLFKRSERLTPTEKSTQNNRGRKRGWGGGGSRDLLTGLRKSMPPPLPPPLYGEREDPFSGPQIANGAKMKCLREPQVQAGVSAGPAEWLFINCSTVHTVLDYCM